MNNEIACTPAVLNKNLKFLKTFKEEIFNTFIQGS
jgi:hypothetical protein